MALVEDGGHGPRAGASRPIWLVVALGLAGLLTIPCVVAGVGVTMRATGIH